MDRFMKEKQAFMLRRKSLILIYLLYNITIESEEKIMRSTKKEWLWSEELLLRNREE